MNLAAINDFKPRPGAGKIKEAFNLDTDFQLMHEAGLAGIFEILERDWKGLPELAKENCFDEQRLGILLNALCSAGFAEKSGESYRLSQESGQYLKSDSPYYLGDTLSRRACSCVRKSSQELLSWLKLENISEGHNPEKIFDPSFVRAMAQNVLLDGSVYKTAVLISSLPGFENTKSLLDLGGGHGLFALALKRLLPELEAKVFDLGQNEETEREYADSWGEDIGFVPGNFYSDPLPEKLDMVLCCDIMYPVSKEKKAGVFKKVYDSLNPGGRFCWKLIYLNEDKISPKKAAEFRLNVSRRSAEAAVLSIEEACELLESLGFEIEKILAVEPDYDWKIISAVKNIETEDKK